MPTITSRGTRIHYERHGGGPAVVLLNGLFQSVERWEPVLPHLAGFTVVRYDMRGQGRSEAPPGTHAPELHAADLRALLEALAVDRYHLIGLSNGGIVAQLGAIDPHPGLASLLVVCSTPYLDAALRAKFRSWRSALDRGGVALRMQVSLPWAYGRRFLDAHPEVLESIDASVATAPSVEAHRGLLDGLLALPDLRPRLARVAARTLVLAGEDDVLFPPSYGAAIANGIPNAELRVLAGLGHQPPVEDPAGFGSIARAWLERGAR